jgi:shikimate dehydrogenase
MPERRAFVCGHPIAHSRSPVIHGFWLAEHGLSGIYEKLDIAPDAFPAFMRELPRQGWAGGNVTIPHKEAALLHAALVDPAAELIGAANTLWIEKGSVAATNTDAYGFLANLDEKAPGWDKGGPAVVLGAGGAARAIIHALQERKFSEIRIVNRTVSRARALADRFGKPVTAHPKEDLRELLSDACLLVNTTPPLGMDHAEGIMPDLDPLPDQALVTDIVYVPIMTPLLARAARRGLRTVDGLGMLLYQAVPGFERWFGVRPKVSAALRAAVEKDIAGQ